MTSNFASLCKTLSLPDEISASYARRNVIQLYDWQVECLTSTGVQHGGNLIYSAPTGGGKTLVAEIAMLCTVIVRRQKAMLVLPYVSLVLEQIKSLRRILTGYNRSVIPSQRIRVEGYYGDSKSTKKQTAHILVCTIEKSNAVLNSMISFNRLHQLGIVVIDEMHVLGDPHRGYHLEILIRYSNIDVHSLNILSKLLLASSKYPSDRLNCQLVALSATMSNLPDIAKWFRADLYATSFRPVPLKEYVCAGGELFDVSGKHVRSYLPSNRSFDQKSVLLELCEEGLRNGQQIIIFCSSRHACQSTANLLVDNLAGRCTHKDTLDAQQRVDASLRLSDDMATLRSQVTHGIAFHHAGLADVDRTAVESMFRSGIISILTATSTLAAGVNLPAGRVIIHSIQIGKERLGSIQYKQMSGRAGRAGLTKYGESYILVKSLEKRDALALCNAPLPAIRSQMQPSLDGGKALMRAIIELFTLRLCGSVTDIDHYLRFTLLFRESPDEKGVEAIAKRNLEFLLLSKVVERDVVATVDDIKITRFGRAVYESNINPDDAILLYDDLLASQLSLNLETNNHLIYLVTPLDHTLTVDFRRIWNCYDKSKHSDCNDAFSLLCGHVLRLCNAHEGCLFKWSHQPPSSMLLSANTDVLRKAVLSGRRDEHSEAFTLLKVRRLWGSLALTMLLDTQSVARVSQVFSTSEADIRQLFDSCSFLANKLFRFCREIGWLSLEKLICYLSASLSAAFSQKCEYSNLLAIPGSTQQLARALFDGGLQTISDVAHCKASSLAQILQLGMQFNIEDVDALEKSLMQNRAASEASDVKHDSRLHAMASSTNLMARLTRMATALKAAAEKCLIETSDKNSASIVGDVAQSASPSASDVDTELDSDDESSFDDDENMQGYMYALPQTDAVEGVALSHDMYLRNDITTPLSASCRKSKDASMSNSLSKTPEPYLASTMEDLSDEDLLALLLDAERNIAQENNVSTSHDERSESEECCDADDRSVATGASPYALPYTPSKLATPGRYLYLPRHRAGKPIIATRARDSKICESDNFGWVHLRKCSAKEFDAFFDHLCRCTCLSFELVFRKLPVSPACKPSKGMMGPANIHAAWKQFVSSFAPQASVKNMQIPPQVLSGICICLGENVGYYVPLPTPLPLLTTASSTDPPLNTITGRGKVRIVLQSLPARAKQLICRLVGFGGIISYRQHHDKHVNPLLSASREWTALSRRELRLHWLKGHSLEWQVLGQVMRSHAVTKITINMKRAALALRERDILIDGPLEDPLIAKRLLGDSGSALDLRTPLSTVESGNSRYTPLIQQCFRSIAVMRCMAAMEQSLRAANLFDLFVNIEMPLVLSLVHAEFHGVRINGSMLNELRACVSDRERSIECVFHEVMGSSFNPSSPVDVAKLKAKCTIDTSNTLSAACAENDDEFCETQQSDIECASGVNAKHPLMQLLSEYRALIRIGPLCGSLWVSRVFREECGQPDNDAVVRVRGTFDGIGTDTGRVIITAPPLQQMPHECRIVQPKRSNLHQELVSLGRSANQMIASLHAKARSGHGEEVKVIAMKCPSSEFPLVA